MIRNKKLRVKLIGLGIVFGMILILKPSYMTSDEKEEMHNSWVNGEFPKQIIAKKLDEIKKEEQMQKEIDIKIKEISDYMNSEEYALREKKNKLRQQTGLEIEDIKPTTFKSTFYSSLSSENGGYTVTCNGKPLKGNIVANNTLPQGTRLLLNGQVYTVADRGSSRFNNPNRLDILEERHPGESDKEYLDRVNKKGVDYIDGYILEVE
jgi:3D (Asp-Asp-Asp) domain-containing protein